ETAVAPLFSGSTRRVSLDKENLTFFRIVVGAICQLSGKARPAHDGLPLHKLSCLACRSTRLRGNNNLLYDRFCFARVFFEVNAQNLADSDVHRSHHFVVSQLSLSLPLKLRL